VNPHRRTAIMATLGPISETRECIEGLVAAGMDAVRLSMSNGTRERHRDCVRLVREIAAGQGRHVEFLADLQSRKNRLGRFAGGGTEWAAGATVVLTARPGTLAADRTWITYPWDRDRIEPGVAVLIDDGALVLTVAEVRPDALHCVVLEGGPVTDGRGVTVTGHTRFPAGLSERDAADLRFALELGVEMVALSFADSPADHDDVRALATDPLVIGKVESPGAVERLPAMATAFDGLMVARGDLALEIPFEAVPDAQQAVVTECAVRGKRSMVATGVLHSLRTNYRPTRAEVADVVTAVRQGAGYLVLTGETGYGRHPVHAVEVLRRIVDRAEADEPLPAAPVAAGRSAGDSR
jgi:pyruvate kinase